MATDEARQGEVTAIIRQKVDHARRADYEAWLHEIVPVASRSPGHRGVNIIRPVGASTEYTIILHFDTVEHLGAWFGSSQRRDLLDKADQLMIEEIEIKTGLEFWFTPPSAVLRAKPYKQFLITLSVIYPLTLLVPLVLNPVLNGAPGLHLLLAKQLIIDAAIVGLITYVIMPRLAKLAAKWLYS